MLPVEFRLLRAPRVFSLQVGSLSYSGLFISHCCYVGSGSRWVRLGKPLRVFSLQWATAALCCAVLRRAAPCFRRLGTVYCWYLPLVPARCIPR